MNNLRDNVEFGLESVLKSHEFDNDYYFSLLRSYFYLEKNFQLKSVIEEFK